MTPPPRTARDQEWRDQAAAALERAGQYRHANALRNCGDTDYFHLVEVCGETPEHYAKPVPDTCHLPICPECQGRAQHRLLDRYMPTIRATDKRPRPGHAHRHVVLTTPITRAQCEADPPLREHYHTLAIRTIQAVLFDKLRDLGQLTPDELRRGRLRVGVPGQERKRKPGAAPLETLHGVGAIVVSDFGEDGAKLHFHAYAIGPYLEQKKLSEKWSELTAGVCSVVYIRRIDDLEDGAKEVIAKYVTKLSELPPGEAPAFLEMTRGIRRVRAFGVFVWPYRVEAAPELSTCPECGSVTLFIPRQNYDALERFKKLHSIQGFKSGESDHQQPTGPPPDPPPKAIPLPGIDLEQLAAAECDT